MNNKFPHDLQDIIASHDTENAYLKFNDLCDSDGLEPALKVLVEAIRQHSHSWFERNVLFLRIFHLGHLAGLSADILSQLVDSVDLQSVETFERDLKRFLYEVTEADLKSKTSTLFYDFEKFDADHQELSRLGLKKRSVEFKIAVDSLLESHQALSEGEEIDLLEIWNTQQGFELLAGLHVSRYVSEREFKSVETALLGRPDASGDSQVEASGVDGNNGSADMKRDLVDGITRVLGGRSLMERRHPRWLAPDLDHIGNTVTAFGLTDTMLSRSILLDILSAVWLFPRGEEYSWVIRQRILRTFHPGISTDVSEGILKFIETVGCSEPITNTTASDCLSLALELATSANNPTQYRHVIRMLTCLSENKQSLKGHLAIGVLREHYLDQVIADLLGSSDLHSWLRRNRDTLLIEELKELILDAFRKGTEREPKTFDSWYDILRSFQKVDANGALLEVMHHMTLLEPGNVDRLNDYGTTLAGVGRYSEAINIFEKLMKEDPKKSGYINNLAFTEYLAGDYEHALQHSEKAIALPDADHHGWHTHGAALHALGRLDEAEKSYRKSIELKREHFDAWEDLIRLLEDMGRKEEAEKTRATYKSIRSRSFADIF